MGRKRRSTHSAPRQGRSQQAVERPGEGLSAGQLGVSLGILAIALLPLAGGGYSGAGYELGFVILPLAAALCAAASPLSRAVAIVVLLSLLPLLLVGTWLHSGIVLWFYLLHIPAAWIVARAAAGSAGFSLQPGSAGFSLQESRARYLLPAAVQGGLASAAWGWMLWLARGELGHHLTSTFGLPNAFGGYLLLAWPAAAICGLRSGSRWRWLWFAAAALLVLTLVLTYSRASLVVLLVQLLVLAGWSLLARRRTPAPQPALSRSGKALLAVGTLAAIVALLAVPAVRGALMSLTVWHDLSLQGRLHFWSAAWRMLLDHPLGVGPGGFAYAYPQYQTSWMFYSVDPHSWVMQALAELGWPGALLVLVVLSGFARWVAQSWRAGAAAGQGTIALLLILAAGGSLAHAAFDFDYTFGATTALLGVLLALGGRRLMLGAAPVSPASDVSEPHAETPAAQAAPSAVPPRNLSYVIAGALVVAAILGQLLSLERMVLDQLRDQTLSVEARERLLRQAASYAPRDALPRHQLAELLAQRPRERDEARELVARALELNPRLAAGWALRAVLTRQREQATAHLDRALRLDPWNSPSFWFARAMLTEDDDERRQVLLSGLEHVPAEHPITPQHLRGPDWYRLNPLWARWWQALANVEPDPELRREYERRATEFRSYSEQQGLIGEQ